jgi:hypothetical protein
MQKYTKTTGGMLIFDKRQLNPAENLQRGIPCLILPDQRLGSGGFPVIKRIIQGQEQGQQPGPDQGSIDILDHDPHRDHKVTEYKKSGQYWGKAVPGAGDLSLILFTLPEYEQGSG